MKRTRWNATRWTSAENHPPAAVMAARMPAPVSPAPGQRAVIVTPADSERRDRLFVLCVDHAALYGYTVTSVADLTTAIGMYLGGQVDVILVASYADLAPMFELVDPFADQRTHFLPRPATRNGTGRTRTAPRKRPQFIRHPENDGGRG